jgi:hypothetical protein
MLAPWRIRRHSSEVAQLDVALGFYANLFGVRESYRHEKALQVLGPGQCDVLVFEPREPLRQIRYSRSERSRGLFFLPARVFRNADTRQFEEVAP